MKLLSCVQLFATPWTIDYQRPSSMGFSRQEYWSGVPLPSPLRYDLYQIPYDYTLEVANRFKGLDLIDRVPEELWTEVRNILQEKVFKTILKKKKMKKGKMVIWEGLIIAEERREAKGKGEKERCTHVNAEFQRITRRNKKAYLSDQCKETEENNRMGKTRGLFKRIRNTKGTFHTNMGIIKDRKSLDLRKTRD